MDRHDRSSVLHSGMAMGRRRERARTPELWIAAHELPATGGHPFYQRLNHVLDTHGFERVRRTVIVALWARLTNLCRAVDTPSADRRPVFTPHHRFELLPVGASE